MTAQMMGAPFAAAGALVQGKMTSDSLDAQADSQMQQSYEAERKGQADAMRSQVISAQKIGTATAAYGASGVTSNSGSVLDVIQASTQNAELDRLNILHGADVKAINYANQAALNRYGAKAALSGSYWNAVGAIMGGAFSGIGNNVNAGGVKRDATGTVSGEGEEAATGEEEGSAGEAAGGSAGAAEGADASSAAAFA